MTQTPIRSCRSFGKTGRKKLCHSHFGDEGPDFAEGLAEDPGVLLPVDVQVVGQAWNEQKERGREGVSGVELGGNSGDR